MSSQDTVHIATKFRNAFLNESKSFQIGNKIASPNHLRQLTSMLPKSLHLISESDLDGKDKMNYGSVERIVSDNVMQHIDKVSDSEGTKLYLKVISMTIDSYLDKTLTPNERLYKMAFSTLFFRVWKSWIKDQPNLTLATNFVSSNANTCIEINFHSLIIGYQRFRKDPNNFPFKPWLWSSQPCEKYFRLARSMTSTFHTKINFDTSEFMGHSKRIQFLQKSMASLETTNHEFPREKNKKLGAGKHPIRIEILEDYEIEEIVLTAKDDLLVELKTLGIRCVSQHWWKDNPITAVDTEDLDTEEDLENQISSEENETYAESEEDIIHVHPDLVRAIKSLNLPDYEKHNTSEENMKKSRFCKIICNEKEYILRKSTLLWLLSSDVQQISKDRLQRFVGKKFVTKINILLESYYAVFYDEGWYIGRVVQQVSSSWKLKFLAKNVSEYKWPKKDDTQIVDVCFIFFGPIKMLGNHPFGISKDTENSINKSYKKLKLELNAEQ